MINDLSTFEYTEINNHAKRTLFLFHGTGGDKNNLLFLNELLDAQYNCVGIQGNVLEDGMCRFFKRLSPGVFDQENIRLETNKLQLFIRAWIVEKNITLDSCYFLGYSNGANMLLASLLYYPQLIGTTVLLHPMMPFKIEPQSLDLSKHAIFVSVGISDQMIPSHLGLMVAETLAKQNATITLKRYDGGHEISEQELKDIITFL